MTAVTAHLRGASDTRAFARALAALLLPGDLLILNGELGAGKTTFTQGLGEGLGVRGPITSPTFVISRVHPSLVGGPALVHVDAYRLDRGAELDDLDLDADMDRAVTVVEWGAGVAEDLADDYLVVELVRAVGEGVSDADGTATGSAVASADPRDVTVRGVGERWSKIDLPAWSSN